MITKSDRSHLRNEIILIKACECSFSSYSSVCDKNKSEVDTSGHYIFTMNLLIKEHINKLKFTQ